MDRYRAVVRPLAGRHGAARVDTRAACAAALAHFHPMTPARDRVHRNLTGRMILAQAFLRGFGFA